MREIVLDDVLMIEPGSKVVVDGVVLHSDALEMDESLLTGESDAVFKQAGQEVFSGSFCIAGAGTMRATRVGRDTALAFQESRDVPYSSIFDPGGRNLLAFRGTLPPQAIPSTVVVDAQGRVAASIIGPVPSVTTLVDVVEEVAG